MIEEKNEQNNSVGSTLKGNKVKFWLLLSDQLKHLYNFETKKLDNQILADTIHNITVFEKELDKPLPWYKKVVATVAFIKQKHTFVVFKLRSSGIIGSVDFYDDHKVQLRLGNFETVICIGSDARKKSEVMKKKSNKAIEVSFTDMQQSLCLGDLISIIYQITPESGYNHLSNNCDHFSKQLYKEVKKEKNGKESLIKSKMFKPSVGFELK